MQLKRNPIEARGMAIRFLAIATLVAAALSAAVCRAGDPPPPVDAGPDYRQAHGLLMAADEERDAGRMEEAAIIYEAALKLYRPLADRAPTNQTEIVRFQTTYCENQLQAAKTAAGRVIWSPMANAVQGGGISEPANATVMGPAATAANVGGPQDLHAMLSQARRLIEQGKNEAARSILLDALWIAPDQEDVRLLLGVTQCQAGRYKDAVLVLEQLAADHPTNAFTHVALGAAYFGAGRTLDAEDATRDALALDAALHEAHCNLAKILLAGAPPDIEQARTHYLKSLELGGERDPKLDALPAPSVDGQPKQHDQQAQPKTEAAP